MSFSLNKKLGVLFSCLVISFTVFAQVQPKVIPEFKLFNLDKTVFTNKNLAAGKPLFFCFFDVSCDHCQHAIEKINQHYSEFSKIAIYLVTLDDQAGIKNFMSHHGQNLPGKKNVTILQDLQNEFIKKFRPVKYPGIFLFSKDKQLILYDDNPDNMPAFLKQIKILAGK